MFDWPPLWLIGVTSFHLICFCMAIGLRNHHTMLSIYLFVLLGMAALTQFLNILGIQYIGPTHFDSNGAFIVAIYSFPLLFNVVIVLVFIMKALISIMIQSKRAQLKRKRK
ncbi:transmembrane protein 18 [Blakeslea trispora]|nr:transmembrane protein 18 [Blakeslea trispora]